MPLVALVSTLTEAFFTAFFKVLLLNLPAISDGWKRAMENTAVESRVDPTEQDAVAKRLAEDIAAGKVAGA